MGPARELRRRLARLRGVVRGERANPAYVPAGHYYSPRTSTADIARAKASRRPPAGIELRFDEQVALAERLRFTVPPIGRWSMDGNVMYGPADAAILRAMLLDLRPRRVVEVGSGFSTAVMLDVAADELPELTITCVEPYADRLRSRLLPGDDERLTLVEKPVQDVDPAELVAGLETDDILFIDSTHVLKAGSDVAHLFLHTLPLVPKGVVVHVHDIFWPFEYPDAWLDKRRDWTEAYLLQAFLAHNRDWEIVLFSSWLWQEHPSLAAPGTADEHPGSVWLRRVG